MRKQKLRGCLVMGIVWACVGWLLPIRTYAVAHGEFAAWTGVRVDWQMNRYWKFRGTFQTRTQQGLKEMERERLNVGVNCRVLPLMQLKGYYELQYRDRGKAGWKIGHRYQAGFVVSGPVGDFKLGWRELFQHTFIGGGKEAQLRSRLQAVYEPPGWLLHPYFSVESFQPVGGGAFFRCRVSAIVRECVGGCHGKRPWMYITAGSMMCSGV